MTRFVRAALQIVAAVGVSLTGWAESRLSVERAKERHQTLRQAARKRLSKVTISDGISRKEATAIAEAYFCEHVGCGAFRGIRNGGDVWIVEAVFGHGARPVRGFQIDKKSGRVTSPIGPSYENPLDMMDPIRGL